MNQLIEESIIEEDPSCACHTLNLVVKGTLDPDKAKVPECLIRDLVQLFVT